MTDERNNNETDDERYDRELDEFQQRKALVTRFLYQEVDRYVDECEHTLGAEAWSDVDETGAADFHNVLVDCGRVFMGANYEDPNTTAKRELRHLGSRIVDALPVSIPVRQYSVHAAGEVTEYPALDVVTRGGDGIPTGPALLRLISERGLAMIKPTRGGSTLLRFDLSKAKVDDVPQRTPEEPSSDEPHGIEDDACGDVYLAH